MTNIALDEFTKTFILFFALQVAFYLYGPGLRRPAFTLKTVKNIPPVVMKFSSVIVVLDVLFYIVMVVLWILIYLNTESFIFFILGFFLFTLAGKWAADHLSIIPAFFVSWALIVLIVIEFAKAGMFTNLYRMIA